MYVNVFDEIYTWKDWLIFTFWSKLNAHLNVVQLYFIIYKLNGHKNIICMKIFYTENNFYIVLNFLRTKYIYIPYEPNTFIYQLNHILITCMLVRVELYSPMCYSLFKQIKSLTITKFHYLTYDTRWLEWCNSSAFYFTSFVLSIYFFNPEITAYNFFF